MMGIFTSTVERWLGSLAATFANRSGLLAIVGLLAALYLLRKLSKKLADKIGIGVGPIVAVALIAVAFFSLRGGLGGSGRLNSLLPPGLVKKAADAKAYRAANAQAEQAIDTILGSTPLGGPTPVPVLPFPNLPPVPHMPTPQHGVIVRNAPHPTASGGTVVIHTATLPAARGGQPARGNAGQRVAIAPPPGWESAPATPPVAAVVTGSDATSSAKPAAAKASPSPKTSVAAAAPASRAATAQATVNGKPDHAKADAAGTGIASVVIDSGGTKPPIAGNGRSMAEEARHTLEMRRKHQGVAAGSGMPGGNDPGMGGGMAGSTGGGAHAPPAHAGTEAAHTLEMRRKHKQSQHAGAMTQGAADPANGGGFLPFGDGGMGMPFHPPATAGGGGQHHATGGNPHHAGGNGHSARRP
jgi:hypothetical protein